jgi:thiazole/oxazole-forming peptide maturase SagD family component
LVALDPAGTTLGELLAGPLAAFDATLHRLPTDAPYAVMLAIVNVMTPEPGSGQKTAVGCACRPNPVHAATKAVFEACQTLRQLALVKANTTDPVHAFEDHGRFYAGTEGRRLLAENLPTTGTTEYLRDQPVLSTGSASSDVAFAVEALGRSGLEVYVADLTTSDVAMSGFCVVRVLIPGMVEMSADPRFARLGGTRLYDLPVTLGLRSGPLAEDDLNLLPVPLA